MKISISILISSLILIVSSCGQATKTNNKREFDRTKPIDKEEQNHLFLNLILERWEKLSNTKFEWQEGDTIDIDEIVLLKYKCDFDTTYYIKSGFEFVVNPYYFNVNREKKDSIMEQLESAVETWNDKLVHSILRIDSCLKEIEIHRVPNELRDKNSFFVVSEPIEYHKDRFWILSRLYTRNNEINTMFIIAKVDDTSDDEFHIPGVKIGEWAIVKTSSAVMSFKISEITRVFENDDYYDERSIYRIFNGYVRKEN